MSRRLRAVAFAGAAALCAALAAATDGPSGPVELGSLREVVVAVAPLPAGRRLDAAAVRDALELRRVPERFAPPDALSAPEQAIGRKPAAPVPAGGYLLASQLARPRQGSGGRPPALVGGRIPVEIAVAGASALATRRPRRVDVVVIREPGPVGGGRAAVAARDVPLLSLELGPEPGVGDVSGLAAPSARATLALTRPEALRLVGAESSAASIRLLARR